MPSRKLCYFSLAIATLLLHANFDPARAAGGAHVVDDAEVETPDTCHLETWATRRSTTSGLVVASPACTLNGAPKLELGLAGAYILQSGSDQQTLGPSAKYVIKTSKEGSSGIAVSGTIAWSSQTRRVETAALIVPLSLHPSPKLDLNLNTGWLWTRTHSRSAAFLGAQVECQLRSQLGLMGEIFDRTDGVPGGQAGIRWSPRNTLDVDFLVSHGFDGTAHANATIGVTIRR